MLLRNMIRFGIYDNNYTDQSISSSRYNLSILFLSDHVGCQN